MRRFAFSAALATVAALVAGLASGHASAQQGSACPINNSGPQIKTGTTYTVTPADQCSLLDFTSASAIAVTLPNANTLPVGFTVWVKAGGAGAVTVTPTTSTIDSGSSVVLNSGASTTVWGNNVNYYTASGGAGLAFTSGQNIVQNGDFGIDQQYAGASQTVQTSLTRSLDRWYSIYTVSSSGGSAPTTQQVALSTGLTITPDELKLTNNSSAATSTTVGMITRTQQSIEGQDTEDLNWGAASGGVPVTVSLYMKSSLANAVIGVSLKGAATLSFVHNCTLGAAATWTYCSFPVVAPTSGTWNNTPGTVSIIMSLAAQCGSTFQTPPDVWTSGTFYCTSSQTQQLGTASSTLEIAAVKMERGTTPTVFVATPMQQNLLALRRYYRSSFPLGTAPAQNSTLLGSACIRTAVATAATAGVFVPLEPPMYATPTTITTYNPAAANAKWRDVTGSGDVTQQVDVSTAKGMSGFEIGTVTDAMTAAHDLCIGWSADSGL